MQSYDGLQKGTQCFKLLHLCVIQNMPALRICTKHMCLLWIMIFQEQLQKLRDERESGAKDLAVLRADLDSTRQERDRLLSENTRLKEETDRIRQAGKKIC